jgi:hypothetical protein
MIIRIESILFKMASYLNGMEITFDRNIPYYVLDDLRHDSNPRIQNVVRELLHTNIQEIYRNSHEGIYGIERIIVHPMDLDYFFMKYKCFQKAIGDLKHNVDLAEAIYYFFRPKLLRLI